MNLNYTVPDQNEINAVMRRLINKFGDKTAPWFEANGESNDSYLWELLRPFTVISHDVALSLISKMKAVYLTWDSVELEHFDAEHRAKLPKNRFVLTNGIGIAEYLRKAEEQTHEHSSFFPDAVYVIPADLSCFVAVTSDYLMPIGRLCITSCSDLPKTGIPKAYQRIFDLNGIGKAIVDNE